MLNFREVVKRMTPYVWGVAGMRRSEQPIRNFLLTHKEACKLKLQSGNTNLNCDVKMRVSEGSMFAAWASTAIFEQIMFAPGC
jgi:hypothetical protein